MFFKKIKDILSGKEKIDKTQQKIEDEFNNGNIVLPTGLVDYEDYKEFKSKTSGLQNIQEQLTTIEQNGK